MADAKDLLSTLQTLYGFIVDVTYADNGHRFVGYKDDVELDKIHPEIEAALNDAQKMLRCRPMNVIYTADGTSIVGAVSDGAVFAGILIGKMEADDAGYLFGCMTEHVCGNALAPSFVGIEFLLTGLRKKYAEGWRLAPPPPSGRQPTTVEEATEYLREELEEAREIFRACDKGSIPRLPARKLGPRARTETKT